VQFVYELFAVIAWQRLC